MFASRLPPDAEKQLLSAIRAGVYPQVAAEGCGLPRRVFSRWMKRGEHTTQGRCHGLWLKICEATAQARMKAEIEVRQKDVKFWLRYGPGKERPGAPGWGASAKSGQRAPAGQQLPPRLVSELMEALEVFPEARSVMAQVVERGRKSKTKHNPASDHDHWSI